MTLLAISTGSAILAWIGLALGLAVAVLVVALFNRVVRPALEIRQYADAISETIGAIARNVEDVDELGRTREIAMRVPDLAQTHLWKQGGGAP